MALNMFREEEKKAPLSQVKHVVAIAAGKGGVGKSSVTVNLALALQKRGFSVGVMDTDLYGPSIRRMLPEDRLPNQKNQRFTPALCRGIRMMSMAYFRKEHEAAVVRAPIANRLIQQFIQQVEWGSLDYLLLDFPPGTGDVQLTLSQHANLSGAVMVTTPQEVAVMDVRKAIDMFHQVKVPIIGIIENMSHFCHPKTGEILHIFGKGGGQRLARDSGVPLLGQIPIDPTLCRYGDEGKSIFDGPETQAAADAFMQAADQFVAHVTTMKVAAGDSLMEFELVWKEMA